MSDWFSTAVEMQREILRAQQAQAEAGRKLMEANRHFTAVQQASQKAAEANLAAWQAWAKFWSGGK